MGIDDARVAVSDDFADMVFQLCASVVKHHTNLMLPLIMGYPRRFTLLLDPATAASTMKQFRVDLGVFLSISSIHMINAHLYCTQVVDAGSRGWILVSNVFIYESKANLLFGCGSTAATEAACSLLFGRVSICMSAMLRAC